jgi:NlpC/P60 family
MKKFFLLTAIILVAVEMIQANQVESVRLVEAARVVEQANESRGAGKWFTRDCSGTVNAIFAQAGFPLSKRLNAAYKNGMNGTAILHAISDSVSVEQLAAGDLVFFNDTYDRNNNGKSDDILTHVGIVMGYDRATGVVDFIHYNTWMDKIVEQQLNVLKPGDKDTNIILRWPARGDTQSKRYAGELIHSFGRVSHYA